MSGRNDLPWDERLALDIEYVRNISFLLDLKIISSLCKGIWTLNVSIRGNAQVLRTLVIIV